MIRMKWPVCVIGLSALFLAGCGSLDSFGRGFLGLQSSPGGGLVVAGSLQTVSQSAQDTLNGMGLMAIVNRDGDTVYVSGRSAKGAHFRLVLTEDRSQSVRQTRVGIEWQDGKDDELAVQILAALGAQAVGGGAQK
jgi:hypothetical protein